MQYVTSIVIIHGHVLLLYTSSLRIPQAKSPADNTDKLSSYIKNNIQSTPILS